jgi:hypothetical protein
MGSKWTGKEIETLRRLYSDTPTNDLANMLGRPYAGVYAKANLLGLRKSEAYMKKILEIEAEKLRILGAKSRFKKGNVPHQKGKKMPPHVIEALSKHWYKKGRTPPNIRPEGHERVNVEGYVELRLERGKYVQKHRYIWQQAGRDVPPGYVVGFKDGNRLNCDIDNLTLITRQEIMARNTIHRLPENLKQTIRTLTNLKRQINAKEQD